MIEIRERLQRFLGQQEEEVKINEIFAEYNTETGFYYVELYDKGKLVKSVPEVKVIYFPNATNRYEITGLSYFENLTPSFLIQFSKYVEVKVKGGYIEVL